MRLATRDDADQPTPATEDSAERRPLLALLSQADYRLFWLASVPWNVARWSEMVISSYLMFELTGSAWMVALLGFCRSAALPVIGPLAGVVADRVDRLALVRGCQLLNVASMAALTALLLAGQLLPWHLLAGALLLGLSWALDWPARRAVMVDLVGTGRLVPSTVLDNLSMNASKIVGPALAGLLLTIGGPQSGFLLLLGCFGASAWLFWLVRRPPAAAMRVTGSPLSNLASGLAYAARERTILGVLLITVILNCLVFPYTQLLPIVAEQTLHVGPLGLGWLAAANGIGALIGLPLIARMRAGGPHGWAFILGSAGLAGTLLLFALCTSFWPALLLLIIGGIGHAGFGTMQGTILLAQARPDMRGRALGVLTLAIGASPFGALMMGALAERGGAASSIAICAGLALAGVALTALLTPALRRAGLGPSS